MPAYVNIPCTCQLPKVQHNKQLEEFLRGEIHCQNFINQDLTFLQPCVVHASQPKDSLLPEKNTIAILPTVIQENILPQEKDATSPQVLPAEALYDRS